MLPAALHPEYKEVLKTYLAAFSVEIDEYAEAPSAAASKADARTACFVVAYPDFEGRVHDLAGVADAVHAAGAMFIVSADPVMLGLMASPGSLGADIVTAEGQSLGNSMNYGGPFLGMMGVTQKYVRKMPGRIVGQAFDHDGQAGFRADAVGARAAHPPREGGVEHLLQPGARDAPDDHLP